jgi:hypothetical protein
MKFADIAQRLTGLSCPIFGISWTPSESTCAIARRIIVFLEDRRVLFVPSEMELPEHCIQSVVEIRRYLTSELQNISNESKLDEPIRAMRAACRKFLERMKSHDDLFLPHAGKWGHWASWEFASALGEMRGTFGIMIAQLAASFGLDIEDGLSSIIPEEDKD